MNVTEFATTHRARVKRDGCGDQIIAGKFGHIYAHDDQVFGLVFEASADEARRDATICRRRQSAIRAGFIRHQWGDVEGIVLFDPTNEVLAQRALKLISARRIRVSSANQLRNLRRGPTEGRSGTQKEGSDAVTGPIPLQSEEPL